MERKDQKIIDAPAETLGVQKEERARLQRLEQQRQDYTAEIADFRAGRISGISYSARDLRLIKLKRMALISLVVTLREYKQKEYKK